MASAGSIFVDLLLRDSQYVAGLKRVRGQSRDAFGGINKDLAQARQAFAGVVSPVNSISAAVGRLAGVFAGALSIQRIVQYSDAWKQLEGRLNLVSTSSEELAATQDRLFKIAQESRSDFGATVTLYQRLTSATKGLGIAQEEVFKFTEQLNKQLITAGLSGNEAAAAVYQLTQAFNKGKLDGDEFRTILEAAPPILEALEKSLGKTRGEILQLSKDGKLAPRVLVDAVNSMSDITDERFSKFSTTVGQAFTQLSNAFLKFIGQSTTVTGATSTLASAFQLLAQNLDLLADAAVGVAIIFGGRLVGSLVATIPPMITLAREMAAVQIALGVMEGRSAAAARGLLALGAAGRLASGALSLVGGPVGAAVIGFVALLTLTTSKAEKEQIKYNETLEQLKGLNAELIGASKERVEQIKIEQQAKLEDAKAELVRAQAQLQSLAAQRNAAKGGLTRYFAEGRVDRGIETFQRAAEQFNTIQAQIDNISKSSSNVVGVAAEGNSEKMKKLNAIMEKYEQILTGVNQQTLDFRAVMEDLNKVKEAGLITDEQMLEALRNYEKGLQETKEATNEWGIDIESFGKKAAENIQDAFADFLFDPFKGGLGGMLKGFIDTVRKMIAEAQAAKLAKYLFGDMVGGSGGGALSGILGSILGSSGSVPKSGVGPVMPPSGLLGAFGGWFADGGYLEPGKWGIAGEEGAELIYGGRSGKTIVPQSEMGGNKYTFNVGTDVNRRDIANLRQMVMVTAGPGVTEQRVAKAQVRGQL